MLLGKILLAIFILLKGHHLGGRGFASLCYRGFDIKNLQWIFRHFESGYENVVNFEGTDFEKLFCTKEKKKQTSAGGEFLNFLVMRYISRYNQI